MVNKWTSEIQEEIRATYHDGQASLADVMATVEKKFGFIAS
jgi:hypothetical protein